MAYKRIRVWSGTQWEQVGSQVPSVLDAVGTGTVTLSSGTGITTFTFGDIVFSVAPQVFVQVTGNKHATIAVEVDTVGVTLHAKGTGSDVITFNWFAIQGINA